MTCRAYVQLPLDLDGIDTRINNQIMENPHDLLFHLSDLDNVRNPDIGTLKREKGNIYFQNSAQRAPKQNSCDMLMKSYLKWLKKT